MCGIFCAVSCRNPIWPSTDLEQLLKQRGPDSSGAYDVRFQCSGHDGNGQPSQTSHITFFSTVLNLRGQIAVHQPCRPEGSQSVLCWNGEAWTIDGSVPVGNDTELVFRLLEEATRTCVIASDRQQETVQRTALMAQCIARINGPYAFVFYDSVNHLLFFGRDFLGRRSLLTKLTEDGSLIISSATDALNSAGWNDVDADGLYYIDLARPEQPMVSTGDVPRIGLYPMMRVPYFSAQDTLHVQAENVGPLGHSLSPKAHGKVGASNSLLEQAAALRSQPTKQRSLFRASS